MEVEAVDEGKLGRILVAAGTDDVLVNTPIAVILGEGETAGDINSTVAKPAPAAAAPAASPLASAAPVAMAAPAASPPSGSRIFASPLAKRIARQKGVDLAAIQGSGPHGRIVLKDVESARPGAASATAAKPAPAAMTMGMSDDAVLKLFAEGSYDLVPHDSMRKVIARRPDGIQADHSAFLCVGGREPRPAAGVARTFEPAGAQGQGRQALWKVSVNDFIIKAMAMAMIKVPDANVSWTENAMVKHKHADIGVAVSIPGGLITPVVRKAETRPCPDLRRDEGLCGPCPGQETQAGRIHRRLRCRLQPRHDERQELRRHRQSAACDDPCRGHGERRPVVRGNEIVIEQQMTITLSTDHRCVDGALGAEFIGAIKMYLEEPGLMLV